MNMWQIMAMYGTHVTILIWFATVCISLCKSTEPVRPTAEHEAALYVDQLQQEVEQEERDRFSVNCNQLPFLEHFETLES